MNEVHGQSVTPVPAVTSAVPGTPAPAVTSATPAPPAPAQATAPAAGSPYRARDFIDLDVNPSVPASPAEEKRLSNQAGAIRDLFRSRWPGGVVTTLELSRISRQYNSRLWELRRYLVRRGFCIDRVGGHGGCHRYRVVPVRTSRFFRQHRAKFELEGIIPPGRERTDGQ
jgi:hypothetical protein